MKDPTGQGGTAAVGVGAELLDPGGVPRGGWRGTSNASGRTAPRGISARSGAPAGRIGGERLVYVVRCGRAVDPRDQHVRAEPARTEWKPVAIPLAFRPSQQGCLLGRPV